MAEIDKTLNQAPMGVEEEIITEEVTTPREMEIEVEEDEDMIALGPSPEDDGQMDSLTT
jgi:hypothetical protein